MIKIKLQNLTLKFDFTFFAVFFLFMLADTSGYGIFALYACLLHETGHLLVMLIVGCKPTELLFYFAGIKITAPNRYKLSFAEETAVLLGGSLFNFLLFAICYFASDGYTLKLPVFAIINLLIGIFNLLPLGIFDGGKITELIISKFVRADTAYYITKIIGFLFTAVALVICIILFCLDIVNFTALATLCYVGAVCLLTDK